MEGVKPMAYVLRNYYVERGIKPIKYFGTCYFYVFIAFAFIKDFENNK